MSLIERALWLGALGWHTLWLVLALVRGSMWQPDSHVYTQLAHQLAEYGTFTQTDCPPCLPETTRLPGYPVLLLLAGLQPTVLVVLQHIVLGFSVVLVGRIAALWLLPQQARWVALAWAWHSYPTLMASQLLTESFFIGGTLAVAYGAMAYRQYGKPRHLLYLAAGATMVVFLKGLGIPAVVLCVGWCVLQWPMRARQWGQLGLALLVPVALLLGWSYRTYTHTGSFAPATQSHVAFWYGRLGGLLAWQQGLDLYNEAHVVRLADSLGRAALPPGDSLFTYRSVQPDMDYAQLSPVAAQAGRAYWWAHWPNALGFQLHCLLNMLQGVGFRTAMHIGGWGPLAYFAAGLQLLLNLALYIGVLLYLWRIRRVPRAAHLLMAIVAVFILLHLAAWADGRYRMIADPLLCVVGGWAWWVWSGKRR